MIGKLKGVVDGLADDLVLLDVHGVGYEVHCSSRTLQGLPRLGEAAVLFIEMIVREDLIRLYGFASEAEREWFRLLQGIQGIGSKTALAVLSTLRPAELAEAIARGDKASLARAPGVGPRVATRIVTELKDKGPALGGFEPILPGAAGASEAPAGLSSAVSDAISALTNLGYPPAQASAAIAAATRSAGEGATTETLIRLGLKEMAR